MDRQQLQGIEVLQRFEPRSRNLENHLVKLVADCDKLASFSDLRQKDAERELKTYIEDAKAKLDHIAELTIGEIEAKKETREEQLAVFRESVDDLVARMREWKRFRDQCLASSTQDSPDAIAQLDSELHQMEDTFKVGEFRKMVLSFSQFKLAPKEDGAKRLSEILTGSMLHYVRCGLLEPGDICLNIHSIEPTSITIELQLEKLDIRYKELLTISVHDARGDALQYQWACKASKFDMIRFGPTTPQGGRYKVQVQLSGQHVKNSPLTVTTGGNSPLNKTNQPETTESKPPESHPQKPVPIPFPSLFPQPTGSRLPAPSVFQKLQMNGFPEPAEPVPQFKPTFNVDEADLITLSDLNIDADDDDDDDNDDTDRDQSSPVVAPCSSSSQQTKGVPKTLPPSINVKRSAISPREPLFAPAEPENEINLQQSSITLAPSPPNILLDRESPGQDLLPSLNPYSPLPPQTVDLRFQEQVDVEQMLMVPSVQIREQQDENIENKPVPIREADDDFWQEPAREESPLGEAGAGAGGAETTAPRQAASNGPVQAAANAQFVAEVPERFNIMQLLEQGRANGRNPGIRGQLIGVLGQIGEDTDPQFNFHRPIGCTQTINKEWVVCDTGHNAVKIYRENLEPRLMITSTKGMNLKLPSAIVAIDHRHLAIVDDNALYICDVENSGVPTSHVNLTRPYGVSLNGPNSLVLIYDGFCGRGAEIREYNLEKLPDGTVRVNSVPVNRAPFIPLDRRTGNQVDLKNSKPRFIDCHNQVLAVSDLGLNCVFLFSVEREDFGRQLLHFGQPGKKPGDFLFVSGIFVDSGKNFLVGDAKNSRVQFFDSNGRHLCVLTLDSPGAQFLSSIHVSPDGHLMVVSRSQHYAAVYKLVALQ